MSSGSISYMLHESSIPWPCGGGFALVRKPHHHIGLVRKARHTESAPWRSEESVAWGASAPAKTGEVSWMKEPHGEEVATHTDPEPCAVVREGGGEALEGARAGRVWSRENQRLRDADALGSS